MRTGAIHRLIRPSRRIDRPLRRLMLGLPPARGPRRRPQARDHRPSRQHRDEPAGDAGEERMREQAADHHRSRPAREDAPRRGEGRQGDAEPEQAEEGPACDRTEADIGLDLTRRLGQNAADPRQREPDGFG